MKNIRLHKVQARIKIEKIEEIDIDKLCKEDIGKGV